MGINHDKIFFNRYALGGYDRQKMVSTVEMFDPRFRSWMMEGSMNEAWGYFGVIVLTDSIYILSGLNNNSTILDTVCISSRISILLWHFMLGFR